MTANEFRLKVEKSLDTLPSSVRDESLSGKNRKLEALKHLNTTLYPELKDNTNMLLQILQIEDGAEKLQYAILWNIAVSQTSPEAMRAIIHSMDDYLARAV